jgi:hypothetical protein
MERLPPGKFVGSTWQSCRTCDKSWSYCHCITGGAYLLHHTVVDKISTLFRAKTLECLDAVVSNRTSVQGYICLSDQVVLTRIYLDNPSLFHLEHSGWGAIATQLEHPMPPLSVRMMMALLRAMS